MREYLAPGNVAIVTAIITQNIQVTSIKFIIEFEYDHKLKLAIDKTNKGNRIDKGASINPYAIELNAFAFEVTVGVNDDKIKHKTP